MATPVEFNPASALGDALVILGTAGIVIPLFARLRITPVIGFILTGILIGPFGLGAHVDVAPWLAYVTINDVARLTPFAEFGIILLLFSVGLELSFNRLWAMRRQVFGLGALEMVFGTLLIASALMALGNTAPTAFALGMALALSSTALVLRITDPRTPVGKAALAMLLFEDIALVPIIFILGAMGRGGEAQTVDDMIRTLWQGGLVILVLLVLGRWLLPYLFAQAARTKSSELFLAISLLVVIVAALVTGATGLSPIVGALIAGLLIAETDYHNEVEAIIDPFKGLALGVFLITVGMSIDIAMVMGQLVEILLAVVAVLVLKAVVTGLLLRAMGAAPGTSTETGILMSSPSETTLIVLATATSVRLISPESAQFWQVVVAIGLTVTPLLAMAGRRLGKRIDNSGQSFRLEEESANSRAIVVGCGRVGRLVAEMLETHGKPYLAIDTDPDAVQAARAAGLHAVYGDPLRAGALQRIGAGEATAIILTMDEPIGAQRLVRQLRAQFPDLSIIARARDAGHAASLYRVGATHAVPETLESSLQLSEAVLVDLGVAMGPVIASIHEKRDEFRAQIMEEGQLDSKPRLKSSTLRERGT